ncbi:LD-carboxypeptidase [Sphingomonas sp. MAH-20]|uniref:LD-carboxypeptidase n=1 Tax=Sphingomonas horti TaxID=2682842 RepID=A0A6I4J0L7_9SPHN|nr:MULTISPECIES: LD-carboxypeptidase [Sphingomonas]MBA2919861.1 LD-carboxypeptidase [Sphingomonas sp. CGMCC 1.13658]MVO78100.1 LD-carboxypeptidase [Sphingomonas horti]
MRIGIVAPSCRIDEDVVQRVAALAEGRAELAWHPQCLLSDGHFAGPDAVRAEALIAYANDPAIDAIWFARGGYGACRIVAQVIDALRPIAREKTYLGYSDPGTLLGALYARGIGRVAHGPMPADVRRAGGEAAVSRALDWLVDGSTTALEPSLGEVPAAAFNIVILAHLIGTRHLPDLSGHVLMIEEVAEYLYRTDRDLAQIIQHPSIRGVAGIRMGRISQVPGNDPDFGAEPEAVVRHWCARAGIPFLGAADIGHDAGNKIVPFGPSSSGA